jgi:hypothetical protein
MRDIFDVKIMYRETKLDNTVAFPIFREAVADDF